MVRPLNDYTVVAELDDISTASTTYVVAPSAGRVIKIYSVIHGAIATADADLTASINGTAITGGVITVATASSAAGDVDEATPSAANDVSEGDTLRIATDGASTGTVRCTITFVVRR